jgi:chemotaxis protein methyltransferase CheR
MQALMEIEDHDINHFTQALKSLSDYDFTEYSSKSLKRRLAKVLLDTRSNLPALLKKMTDDPTFLEEIIKEITVNTTELFRDPPIWHTLRFDILPRYMKQDVLNIWHAGCSTGQEVYSMLILLHDLGLFNKTNLVATDLNSDVLEAARKGAYKYRFNIGYLDNFDKVIRENPINNDDHRDIPYSDYFQIDHTRDLITFRSFLLEKPVFRKMDLVHEKNPFTEHFDIIMCRNVIIYFNFNLQNKVFRLFHDNLSKGGHLILGVHETILGPLASFFERNNQVYIKK